MTALQYILSLRPALPMSAESPCTHASNGEIRRWLQQGAVLCNGERLEPNEPIDFPVFSLVFFPKSANRRTTII